MTLESQARAKVADLASGDDEVFKQGYVANVVNKHGSTGTWVYAWYNPRRGAKENWYYSFRPVNGTPYQLVLTAVDREIEGSATALESRIRTGIIVHFVLTSFIFSLTFAILICASRWFNRAFVMPIESLVKLVSWGEQSGYSEEVPEPREEGACELTEGACH